VWRTYILVIYETDENCNRDQATTKDGQQCFNTCYPKKGTHAIAKHRTPPPSFGHHRDCTFFSRNAYCLVTNKRICRIEKVD
jgi:hypothetical protein